MKQHIIIAGSREMTDYNRMKKTWAEYASRHQVDKSNTIIISGGAAGADRLAERLAAENGIEIKVMKADWTNHGKSAGHIRNAEMIKAAGTDGHLLAYWNGQSKGTAGTIKNARRKGLHVEVIAV